MDANWILRGLSPACRDFLADRVMTKPIHSGEILFEAGAPAQNVIFPLNGLISLRLALRDGRLVEHTAVGCDGIVGGLFLVGQPREICTAMTVISGTAAWLPMHDFTAAADRFPCLRPALLTCMAQMMRRLMQSVACAAVHSATQRVSSWLLHADDRVHGDSFDITQRMLADIFSLRPATVSEACNKLLSAGAIHYSRGNLSVLDRDLLETQACECYEAVCLDALERLAPARFVDGG